VPREDKKKGVPWEDKKGGVPREGIPKPCPERRDGCLANARQDRWRVRGASLMLGRTGGGWEDASLTLGRTKNGGSERKL